MMVPRTTMTIALVTATLGAMALDAAAQGCAMCGNSFAPNDPVTRAINWSVFVLIAAPYTLAAVVGGWLAWTYRRAALARRASIIAFPGRPEVGPPPQEV